MIESIQIYLSLWRHDHLFRVFFLSFTKCNTIIIFKSVHFYMYMYLYQSIKNKFQNYFNSWMYWNHKIHHPYIGADWKYIEMQVWLAKFFLSIHPSTDPFIHPSSLYFDWNVMISYCRTPCFPEETWEKSNVGYFFGWSNVEEGLKLLVRSE